MWYDTFDYATRVEYLSIGVYGNRVRGRNCVIDMDNYVAPLTVSVMGTRAADLEEESREKWWES